MWKLITGYILLVLGWFMVFTDNPESTVVFMTAIILFTLKLDENRKNV